MFVSTRPSVSTGSSLILICGGGVAGVCAISGTELVAAAGFSGVLI